MSYALTKRNPSPQTLVWSGFGGIAAFMAWRYWERRKLERFFESMFLGRDGNIELAPGGEDWNKLDPTADAGDCAQNARLDLVPMLTILISAGVLPDIPADIKTDTDYSNFRCTFLSMTLPQARGYLTRAVDYLVPLWSIKTASQCLGQFWEDWNTGKGVVQKVPADFTPAEWSDMYTATELSPQEYFCGQKEAQNPKKTCPVKLKDYDFSSWGSCSGQGMPCESGEAQPDCGCYTPDYIKEKHFAS